MTSLLTSCHIQHVCWHYKSVYFIVTWHRQRSTKLLTTYANVWMRAFWRILCILCKLGSRGSHNFVKVGDNWLKLCNLAHMGTCNRCVKNRLKILNRLWKKWKKMIPLGGFFLTQVQVPSSATNPDTNSPPKKYSSSTISISRSSSFSACLLRR